MSESRRVRYDCPPAISGESVLVLGDLQIPYHDAAFVNRAKTLALDWGIRALLLGGDAIDLSAFSIFLTRDCDGRRELDESEVAFAELIRGFDHVLWIMGNHEARLFKDLNVWLGLDRIKALLRIDARVESSDYFFALVGDDWMVTHPKNTSVIPARVATWLAEKERRNVATLHDHVCGMAQTRGGERIGISVGMCADPYRLEYVATRQSTRPAMTQGALILRWDSEAKTYWPHHLHQWTDWQAMQKAGECGKATDFGSAKRTQTRNGRKRR